VEDYGILFHQCLHASDSEDSRFLFPKIVYNARSVIIFIRQQHASQRLISPRTSVSAFRAYGQRRREEAYFRRKHLEKNRRLGVDDKFPLSLIRSLTKTADHETVGSLWRLMP